MIYEGKKYNLSRTQLTKIARLCYQEQGKAAAPAEASLMANLWELKGSKIKGKDGKPKYSSLYDYVRNGGWFARAAHWMDNGTASTEVIAAVRDVLVNGNRVLPLFIDEHDCYSDIASASNNGVAFTKTDRRKYKQGVTVIKNRMGSVYTFWCFPSPASDPFGYTANARAPKGKSQEADPDPRTCIVSNVALPQLSSGDKGKYVKMWQSLIECAVDGTFGEYTEERTKKWQKEHGLIADGIVGIKSWTEALS